MTWMTGTWQRKLAPYIFISPFFVGYAVFFGYPVLSSLYLSFFKQTGFGSGRTFVGLDNYIKLLSDELFLKALGNTTFYALGSIFIIVPAALGLALILTIRRLRLREFFRLFFFAPYVMSGVVIAIVFTLVFEGQYGLVNNYLLAPLGLPKVDW